MKALLQAVLLVLPLICGAAVAAGWGPPGGPGDAGQKGGWRDSRGDPRDSGRDRPGGQDPRRGGLPEDERQRLHQDLDKANRELYRRRP